MGCERLLWEKHAGRLSYDIIDLNSVRRKVHIVPDFAKKRVPTGEDAFYVNRFKWMGAC